MEKITVYTRSMIGIMKPLMDQVELFSSYNDNTDGEDFPKPQVEDICKPLLQLQDPCFSKDVVMLKVALRDFYDAVDMMKKQKKINEKNKNAFQKLMWYVYKLLVKKDTLAVQNIKSIIKKWKDDFSKFEDNVKEKKHHLKAFVENGVECLNYVRNRIEDLISKKHRQQLLLSVRQIAKSVPLLVTSWTTHDHIQLLNSYIFKRISWCFLELEKAVENSTDTFQQNIECGGQFVQKMDVALDILSSDIMGCNEVLKVAVDEVLCHAMSIAHVAVLSDRNNISRSCQKVLRALEELKQRYATELPVMQELLVGALTDTLERLEQQVNAALLQLVLEVFSTLFLPLKQILEATDGSKSLMNRTSEDLDDNVAVFDLLMDRIMQIGLFAIACSEDTHRVVGICSCLASLESLEPELVPALIALYLDPENSAHRIYLQVLVCHWQEEVTELQVLLNGIVDPAAFCEVALHDLSQLVANIKGKLSCASPHYLKLQVGTVLKKAVILRKQLNISFKEEHGDALPSNLKQPIEDFIFSCNELNAASEMFLNNEHSKDLTTEDRRRLLKRCELLISMLKRLHPLLIDVTGNSSKENTNAPKLETKCVKGSTLLFPDTLKDVPVDLDTQICEGELSCVKNNFTDLMKRGKALAKDRSIPYCTPKKKWEHSVKLMHLRIPQIRNRSIFNCTNSPQEPQVDQTLGLDITNILENLTSLSDTLSSAKPLSDIGYNSKSSFQKDAFAVVCETAALSDCGIMPTTDSFLFSLKSPTVTGSTFDMRSTSHEVDTLQRIDDLKAVKEKIACLRANNI